MSLILGKYRGQDNGVVANVASPRFGAMGDGVTDDTPAFLAAIATGLPVVVPNTGQPYIVTSRLVLNNDLIGERMPTIKFVGASLNNGGCIETGTTGITISGLTVDADSATKTSNSFGIKPLHDGFVLRDCSVFDARSGNVHVIALNDWSIEGCNISNGQSHGITADACNNFSITNCYLNNNAMFGCIVRNGCTNFVFQGNRCSVSGLELLGVTYDCTLGRVVGNHAEGTGDNGISITGSRIAVVGNVCRNNDHNGICLYGSFNTAVGNECWNNNQVGSTFSGISVNPNFGGAGSYNTVIGNSCGDNQATPTQRYGIEFKSESYTEWASGQAVGVSAYRRHNVNIYKAATAGTTGATAPTHTSGSVSDGGVTWLYVTTAPASNGNPLGNHALGNTGTGNVVSLTSDTSANANAMSDVGRLNLGDVNGSSGADVFSYGGYPSGNVAAPLGSLCMRRGGTKGISLYTKTDDHLGPNGWSPVALRLTGTGASRPAAAAALAGQTYWNETTGKLNVCTGTAWVHADGTAA